MKIRFTSVALVLVVAFVVAVPLFAHMKIEKTEPAADSTVSAEPKQVQVWFNETPDIKVTKMNFAGPSGALKLEAPKVEGKSISAAVEGKLADGAYTVTWQSSGDDGHVQKGEFKFNVKTK